MRTPGEVVAENRSSPLINNSSSPLLSGRSSPMLSDRSSPLRISSPTPERKDISDSANEAINGAIKGINRAHLTLQELQDLAERQRQQILYNSKELMDKQQQLMKMHQDFRSRTKAQKSGSNASNSKINSPKPPNSPKPKVAGSKREQDQYARMLRETYQNMGKMHNRNQIQSEIDVKKFSNEELAHELEKVRVIFSSKQNELADAVKKVDVLTHQLETRKNGESGWATVPTPERINRRKKIQAAKDELDRLRNELVVRNEMNSQQSYQLQLQHDIIQEKKQELRELNSRMNQLGNALHKQHGKNVQYDYNRKVPNYVINNGDNASMFNGNYLQDTLSRKRPFHKQIIQDINANDVTYMKCGNIYVTPDGREFDHPPTINDYSVTNGMHNGFESDSSTNSQHNSNAPLSRIDVNSVDNNKNKQNSSVYKNTPLSGNEIWRNKQVQNLQIRNDVSSRSPSLNSPTSSVSSLSSMSSSSITPDDVSKSTFQFNNKPPAPPHRTTAVGVLINRNEPSPQPSKLDIFNENLWKEKETISELQNELNNDKIVKLELYSDSRLSADNDKVNDRYKEYFDASSSCTLEQLPGKNKLQPPAIKPKPVIPPKPAVVAPKNNETIDKSSDVVDKVPTVNKRLSLLDDDTIILPDHEEHSHLIRKLSHEHIPKDSLHDEDQSTELWPSPNDDNVQPTEPEDFELSFADIDEINKIQPDLWSNSSGSSASQYSYDSGSDENDVTFLVPVVISVSPDKMPPPILIKPDKPHKGRGRIVLDPFALLLDSALEGEMDVVRETLNQVPDPSRPNPEGITALHNAVCGNHKEVVRFLVEVGCDINSADNNGWTPLHCAAFYNDTELCRYLVEHGASVFATTYTDYQTPAHKCSRLDDNYDVCFGYLHECKENVGRTNGGLVHALFDYTAENEDELDFLCGDMLTILRRGDTVEKEWWWARNRKGDTGYVPCNLIGNFPRIAAEV